MVTPHHIFWVYSETKLQVEQKYMIHVKLGEELITSMCGMAVKQHAEKVDTVVKVISTTKLQLQPLHSCLVILNSVQLRLPAQAPNQEQTTTDKKVK